MALSEEPGAAPLPTESQPAGAREPRQMSSIEFLYNDMDDGIEVVRAIHNGGGSLDAAVEGPGVQDGIDRRPAVREVIDLEETADVEVVDRDDLFTREPELLQKAAALMGRLPFPELDVLIIGELGKNYSGSGMDPNVLGRMLIEASPEAFSATSTRELVWRDVVERLADVLRMAPEASPSCCNVWRMVLSKSAT